MDAIRCNEIIRSWWFLVLVYLIDSGDGRGNEDVNQLRRDVRILHQLTDSIQHEMKLFYDQDRIFSEDLHTYETKHHTKKHHHKHHNSKPNILKTAEHIKLENLKKIFSPNVNSTHHNFISDNVKISNSKINSTLVNNKNGEINKNDIYWPKFDEILRLVNSKYDWKNDRWIKLKNTSNKESKNLKFNNVEIVETKPRFRYSRVKIDGGNSKRNVVIAISAMPKDN